MAWRWVRVPMVALLGAMTACEGASKPPQQTACVQTGPAFRLLLRAPEGPLPGDTRVQVTYQGNLHESFGLAASTRNEDLCCAPKATIPSSLGPTPCESDAGLPTTSEVRAIQCDLWSNGAAQVVVRASGYQTTVHDLEAEVDEECETTIVTSDVTLVLERGDAAPE